MKGSKHFTCSYQVVKKWEACLKVFALYCTTNVFKNVGHKSGLSLCEEGRIGSNAVGFQTLKL